MTGRARRPHVVLRHEGDRASLRPGDLLDPVLVERVAIRHLQGLGIAKVDLLLTASPLALGELHGHARRLHVVADGTDQRLLLRGLQDVIVLQIARHGGEPAIALGPRLVEGLPEEVELQLRASLDEQALLPGPLDLAPEHPAWSLLDGLALLGVDVAEDQGRLGEPGDEAPGAEIGLELHVAVAALPRRQLEARERLHLHVHREEIDAGVDPVLERVIEEVAPHHALAHQAAEAVREHREDGVHLAPTDQRLESLSIHLVIRHATSSRPTLRGRAGDALAGRRPRNLSGEPDGRQAGGDTSEAIWPPVGTTARRCAERTHRRARLTHLARAPALPAQPCPGGRFGRGAKPPSE